MGFSGELAGKMEERETLRMEPPRASWGMWCHIMRHVGGVSGVGRMVGGHVAGLGELLVCL